MSTHRCASSAARNEATKRFEAVIEKIQGVVERVAADVTKRARATDADETEGRGRADKNQVARLVGAILGLPYEQLPGEDACDALAIAITHAQAARVGLPGGEPT